MTHIFMVVDRGSEITLENAADPSEVLNNKGFVQTELYPEFLNLSFLNSLLLSSLTHINYQGVSGEQPHYEEYDNGYND